MVAVGFLQDLQIGTPRCISHVAAVWRRTCGVTLPRQAGQPYGRFDPFLHRCNRLRRRVPIYSPRDLIASVLQVTANAGQMNQCLRHSV